MKVALLVSTGDAVDFATPQRADQLLIAPALEFKFGRSFNAKLEHSLRRLDVAGGELFTENLSQLRLVYQFNLRMFVRTIMQYRDIVRDPSLYTFPVNAKDEDLFTELLYSYKINPQTVAFVGYSDGRVGTETFDLTRANRTFFVKLGYAWLR